MPTAVCLTVDFDGVSPWLHGGDESNTPTNRSRGIFGVDVGAPRLLDLLDRRDVASTWFVPGHTADSFPDAVAAVADAGHDVEHHGWSHTPPRAFDSRAAERADLERGIESLREVVGRRPTGYRSPSWDHSAHTVELLVDLGFEWDSSGMAHDFRPYPVRRDWSAPQDGPYDRGVETDLVEVPVSWQRDDFPPLAFVGDRGFVDERAVFDGWRAAFDWVHEHVEDAVFVLTVHPQVIGRSPRIARLEDLLEHMAGREGVRFEPVVAVVERFRQG